VKGGLAQADKALLELYSGINTGKFLHAYVVFINAEAKTFSQGNYWLKSHKKKTRLGFDGILVFAL
jgi:hypothetical protein